MKFLILLTSLLASPICFAESESDPFQTLIDQFSELPEYPRREGDPKYSGNEFVFYNALTGVLERTQFITPSSPHYLYRDFRSLAPDLLPELEAMHLVYEEILREHQQWKTRSDLESFAFLNRHIEWGTFPEIAPQKIRLLLQWSDSFVKDFFAIHMAHKKLLTTLTTSPIDVRRSVDASLTPSHLKNLEVLSFEGGRSRSILEAVTKSQSERMSQLNHAVLEFASSLIDFDNLSAEKRRDLESLSNNLKRTHGEVRFEIELLARVAQPAVEYGTDIIEGRISVSNMDVADEELRRLARGLTKTLQDSFTIEVERSNGVDSQKLDGELTDRVILTDAYELLPRLLGDLKKQGIYSTLNLTTPKHLEDPAGHKLLFHMFRQAVVQQSILAVGAVITKILAPELPKETNRGFLSTSNRNLRIGSATSASTEGSRALREAGNPRSENEQKLYAKESRLWSVFFGELTKDISLSDFTQLTSTRTKPLQLQQERSNVLRCRNIF